MRIAVVGTHSTGKTTLIRTFVDRYSELRIAVIPEIATQVIASGYPLGKNGNIDSYVEYINEQLKAERQAERGDYDILLADRTILDGAVHPLVNRTLPRPYLSPSLVEMFFGLLHLQKSFYDLYAYLPIEFSMAEHANRPPDEAYRARIDEEIRRTLQEQNVNYITLTGSVIRRCESLNKRIEEYRGRVTG